MQAFRDNLETILYDTLSIIGHYKKETKKRENSASSALLSAPQKGVHLAETRWHGANTLFATLCHVLGASARVCKSLIMRQIVVWVFDYVVLD